jgi:hypothetical protein
MEEPLELEQLHFVIMSSSHRPEVALLQNKTLCSFPTSRCTFAAEAPLCIGGVATPPYRLDEMNGTAMWTQDWKSPNKTACLDTLLIESKVSIDPEECGRRVPGFFGGAKHLHQRRTLPAQLRFLMAIAALQESDAAEWNLENKWLILIDDDSLVFPGNLMNLLGVYNSSKLYYMGDEGSINTDLFDPGLHLLPGNTWKFICGGSGSILSRGLMEALEVKRLVKRCIKHFQPVCTQSDWMIAFCVQHLANEVQTITSHGCGDCPSQFLEEDVELVQKNLVEREDSCHFIQHAMHVMPHIIDTHLLLRGAPSIIHSHKLEPFEILELYSLMDPITAQWRFTPAELVAAGKQLPGYREPHGAFGSSTTRWPEPAHASQDSAAPVTYFRSTGKVQELPERVVHRKTLARPPH